MNICIIPCRKGSKRLKNKNIRELGGKQLISWTLRSVINALNYGCPIFQEIIITTDIYNLDFILAIKAFQDSRIKIIARPSKLCQVNTPMIDVILHVLKDYEANTNVVLVQPTTPFIIYKDIEDCYQTFIDHRLPVVSAHWDETANIRINGGIYINTLKNIRKEHSIIPKNTNIVVDLMPYERSIDIDTTKDWDEAERIAKHIIK